jgi:ankyrin repeat protein
MRRDELIEQALDKLPKDLDETYARIMRDIEKKTPHMADLAHRALMWILYAARPLRTIELQHALATDCAYQAKANLDLNPVEVILEACGNLVVEENGVVRPIHYSVQEFFTSPSSGIYQGPPSLLDSCIVHEILACTCMRYMRLGKLDTPCQDNFDLYSRAMLVKLACYATRYFDYHIRQAKTLSPQLLGLLEDLLKQDVTSLAAILQLRRAGGDWLWDSIQSNFSPIPFPVDAGTIILATQLFEIDEVREHWLADTIPKYALHQASRTGGFTAVRWLLDLNIKVNEKDDTGITPLYYATLDGHSVIITLLCKHGASVNAQGGWYGNALCAACYGGHLEAVRLLFEKGADVNAQGGEYGNALQAACIGGHLEMVKELLARGAGVNAQGGWYGNALYAACDGGHLKVVRLLFEKGADVNAQGGQYGNALQAACFRGHLEVVKELLARGADVNTQGGYYGNALQAACYKGHLEAVKEMLARGADVNAQGGYFGNALQAACYKGPLEVVKEMLARGADVNAQGGRHGNALQAARIGGNKAIIDMFNAEGVRLRS